ncbi:protein kinase family protein [Legionella geestiana]|uniref:RIO1 family regulatory kinase/ATPase domain-containing protein n=1 Tax=Legionella geestiana TaxID=45065 RepID=UPI0010926D48|nr:RIO1 family regulatory kinase/ATPase [Legionella geestiana]QDQ40860.1 protein kinase family protein [Legionella geestiana]
MYEFNKRAYFDTLAEAKMALLAKAADAPFAEAEKESLIEALKIALEQHDDKEKLLATIQETQNAALLQWMQPTLDIVKHSVFGILPFERINEHPLIGGYETFISANLFLNPTDRMVEVRNKVSAVLLATLEYYQAHQFRMGGGDNANYESRFHKFAFCVIFELSKSTYPGLFVLADVNNGLPEFEKISPEAESLSPNQVNYIINLTINRLKSPDTRHYEVMAIHILFAHCLLKKVPMIVHDDTVHESDNPVFIKILQEYNHDNPPVDMAGFFNLLRVPGDSGDKCRSFVSDAMMYKKDFYWFEPERGRGKPEPDTKTITTTLGVMRSKNVAMRAHLPQLEFHPAWVDWTQCPVLYSTSEFVAAFMRHETPFISSYSGTVSLGFNLMIATNALKTLDEQQIYFTSLAGYIAGSGFHSLHEIIAPTAFLTHLFSQEVYLIDKMTSIQEYKAPHYYNYFHHMMRIDPQFAALRSDAWERYLNWYRAVYIPNAKNTSLEEIINTLIAPCLSNNDPEKISHLRAFFALPLEPEFFATFDRLVAKIYYRHTFKLLPLFQAFYEEQNPARASSSSAASSSVSHGRDNLPAITGYQRALELINSHLMIDAKLNSLFYTYKHFRFVYVEGNIHLLSQVYTGRYCSSSIPLHQQSVKIMEAMQTAGISQSVIDEIINRVEKLDENAILTITEKCIVEPFIESLLAKDFSEAYRFDWEDFVEEITSSDSIEVLKNDDDRQHLIYLDENTDTVHKIKTLKMNVCKELQVAAKEENLFYRINKRTLTVKASMHYIEIIMPFLGEPLSELTELHGTEQWQVIKQQAIKLVESLHQLRYVHGDISLDNFVLGKDGKLFLIDFETARKIKPSNTEAVRLKLFSMDLRKHGVNPEHYTPAAELHMVNEVFKEVCNEPCMSDNSADCSFNP